MSELLNHPSAPGVASAPEPRPVRFFHRGQVVAVEPTSPTRTVLEWLREDARCTGTKEGCAEGDCGACTVVVGELDAHGQLTLQAVNACIRFLPTLDGKALFTVEDLAGAGGELHPAQQALVDCHGSQCGFCTPGFVMSLWHCHQQHPAGSPPPERQALADALSGNLCRCTGYRPILDAGQAMFQAPRQAFDSTPAVAALQALAAEPALQRPGWHAPRTLDELAALRVLLPNARLLAGGTDVGLWVTKQLRTLPELIYLGDVVALREVAEVVVEGQPVLHIGAGASLEAAWAALVQRWPSLRDMALRFASPPVRAAGTMGGNVANGSPIGDAAPVLMALDARLLLRCGPQQRRLPLHEFYLAYMKNALAPGEFLQAIEVPLQPAPGAVRAYKISKRFDSDISAVSVGCALSVEAGVVRHVRLAFGGLAATVRRAAAAEAALLGQPWTEASVAAAQAALAAEFQPLSDMRASAAYRLQVAQNLLMRLWLQTRPDAPLTEAEVSVFARGTAVGSAA